MRTNNIKVKITIPFSFDAPDANGVVYSKEAVLTAISSLRKGLPIIFKSNEPSSNGSVIGTTVGESHIVTFDSDKKQYNVTVEGIIFAGGTECIVKNIEDNVIKSFEIVGVGVSL